MKKFRLLVFLCLTLNFSLFGADGLLSGEKNLQVAKTQWFDIIYPESCTDSAAVLFSEADEIYEKLSELYRLETPPCRIPVVLTSQVELFNAYFSNGYYNHIVLYVTSPSDSINDQPDSLLSTFKHELTHALTYNIKSSAFKIIGKIFGDAVTLSLLTVTSGMAEGATLTSESMDGYGRLNDEFSKQSVKQAKLENLFPSYYEIQGARDIYPTGDFYYFNGAFHKYLQDRYGMEKYQQWWYLCNNSEILTSSAFKKAFGVSLTQAWKDFQDTYEIPEIPANPVTAGIAKDFFEPEESDFSVENKANFRPKSLSVSQKGITYINEANRTLYFVSTDELNSEKVNPKKLFQYFYMESACQSEDGKYIALTYFDSKSSVYNYHVEIYDTEQKKWIYKSEKGHKNGTVIKNDDEYYLISLKFKGEKNQIEILPLNNTDEIETVYIDFDRNVMPLNFVQVDENHFAYILKNKMDFSVQISDFSGNITNSYALCNSDSKEFPNFIMKYLSHSLQNPDELYFSWVCKGTMPRAGKLNLGTGIFQLSSKDFSGGVYYPIADENGDLYYSGTFYKNCRLFKAVSLFDDAITVENPDLLISNEIAASQENIYSTEQMLLSSKKYNPFSYMIHGTIYPYSSLTSTSYNKNSFSESTKSAVSYNLPFGITYLTNNPWDSKKLALTAGYGIDTNSWALDVDLAGGTSTSLFTYDLSTFCEFDSKGWKAAEINTAFSCNFDVGLYSTISLKPTNLFHIGRSNNSESEKSPFEFFKFGIYENIDPNIYLYDRAGIIFSYNSVRSQGDSRYSRYGFMTGLYPYLSCSYNLTQSALDYCSYDVGLFSLLYIPHLLPVKCPLDFTYNFPVKIATAVFSSNIMGNTLINLAEYPNLAFIGAETVIFGYEIQKAIPFFPYAYFYDVNLSLAGAFGYSTSDTASFGFLKIPEYYNDIAQGVIKPQGSLSVELTVGVNPLNLGGNASSSGKYYITGSFDLLFSNQEVKPVFNLGIRNKF